MLHAKRYRGLKRSSPILGLFLMSLAGLAQAHMGYPGTRTEVTHYPYPVLLARLKMAVKAHHMVVVAQASASHGAAQRGIKIPGNAVVMVFRNDFAVTMLKDSLAAGIAAPLRIYVTANSHGTADITYRTPSAVFAPYHNRQLNALAQKLDPIFAGIVQSGVITESGV